MYCYPTCEVCGRAIDLLCTSRQQARRYERASGSIGCLGCRDTTIAQLFSVAETQDMVFGPPEPQSIMMCEIA